MDANAIDTAIAARYAPAQVTPPAGLGNIRSSSADLPNRLGPLPAMLVFPDSGAFPGSGGGHGTRLGRHRRLARFYFARSKDLPRELNACRKWLTVLLDQLETGMQLGGAALVASVVDYRIATLPYGGIDHTGIELGIEVQTSEPWTPTP
jgi:hypothetical protein